MAREFTRLKEIEGERAKRRQAHGQTAPGKTLMENLPQPSEGTARDIAAQKLGMSGKSAEMGVQVGIHGRKWSTRA